MPHNIETLAERDKRVKGGSGFQPFQPGTEMGDAPILTVGTGVRADKREIIFYLPGVNEPRLVVNPWITGQTIDVAGEDLYALREFLNELPEEAFVRPADPVFVPDPPPAWEDGDVFTMFSVGGTSVITYTRVNGEWVRTVLHSGEGKSYVDDLPLCDEKVDRLLDGTPTYLVLRRGGKAVR